MNRKKNSILTVVAGTIVVLLGIFFQIMTDYRPVIILTFINAGTLMIVIGAISYNKKGVGHDERTKKMGAKAISVSWFITFIVLNILFWVDQLQLLQLTVKQVISILMPLMLLSASILQWFYKRKGDVE